jgi:hypothetical protein
MEETIKCPYTQDGALSHAFHHEFQIKNGYIIHYCGKCKKCDIHRDTIKHG